MRWISSRSFNGEWFFCFLNQFFTHWDINFVNTLTVGGKSLFFVARKIFSFIVGVSIKFVVPAPQSIEVTPAGSTAMPSSSRTKPRIVLTEEQVNSISGLKFAAWQAFWKS